MIYDYKPDIHDINRIECMIKSYGVISTLDKILNWSNCTKIYKDGSRPLTTHHYGYKIRDWEYQYVLNYANKNNIDVIDYKNKFIELHNKNLEFESINPPTFTINKIKNKNVNDKNKNKKSKSNIRKVVTKDIFTDEESIEFVDKKGNFIKQPNKKLIKDVKFVFNFNLKK